MELVRAESTWREFTCARFTWAPILNSLAQKLLEHNLLEHCTVEKSYVCLLAFLCDFTRGGTCESAWPGEFTCAGIYLSENILEQEFAWAGIYLSSFPCPTFGTEQRCDAGKMSRENAPRAMAHSGFTNCRTCPAIVTSLVPVTSSNAGIACFKWTLSMLFQLFITLENHQNFPNKSDNIPIITRIIRLNLNRQ